MEVSHGLAFVPTGCAVGDSGTANYYPAMTSRFCMQILEGRLRLSLEISENRYNRLRHDNRKTRKPADLARYRSIKFVPRSIPSAIAAKHAAQIS